MPVRLGEIMLPEGVERYGPDLHPIRLDGFTVKRATRAALLSAAGGLNDLFYEVAWRERQLDAEMRPADFLASPATVAAGTESFSRYLAGEGVEAHSRAVLLADLEACQSLTRLRRWSGWVGSAGLAHRLETEDLQLRLGIVPEHRRLLDRLLRMLSEAGALAPSESGRYIVAVGADEPLLDGALMDPESLADSLARLYPPRHQRTGVAAPLRLCPGRGVVGPCGPLGLLFSDEGPSVADLYREAPAARAANRMLGEVVAAAVSGLSHEGRLRLLLQGLPGDTPLRGVVHLMESGLLHGARKSSTKTSPQVQLESG